MKNLILIILVGLFSIGTTIAETNPSPAPEPVCSAISDKLQSALADVVNKSVQVAGDAKDFLVKQVPDVIRQLLLWKAMESAVKTIIVIIPMFVFAFILRRAIVGDYFRDQEFNPSQKAKEFYDQHSYWPPGTEKEYMPRHGIPKMIMGVVSIAGTAIFFVLTLVQLSNPVWLQIWLAPKVFLIEYAKTLSGH